MNRTLRQLVVTLVREMRWKVPLALALAGSLSLTEGMGLVLLLPLLQVVSVDLGGETTSWLADITSSVFVTIGVHPNLYSLLGLLALVLTIRAVLNRWQTMALYALPMEFASRLRQQLYQSIVGANWLFISRSRASDFTHALTTEVDRVAMATQSLLSFTVATVVTSTYIILALFISATMTVLVLGCGIALWLVLRRKTTASHASGEALSIATNHLYAMSIEQLAGIKVVKSYGAQDRVIETFSKSAEYVAQAYRSANRTYAEARFWFDLGTVWVLCLFIAVSIELLSMPISGMILLFLLFARLMPRLSGMQQCYQDFLNKLPAFATVVETQKRCEAATDPVRAGSERVDLRYQVRLEHVTFAYAERDLPPVACDLSLTIRAGETTALVGPSGAGKSTVADLVMGLIPPCRGQVLVDEVPLDAHRMRSWRNAIGYVAQDTFLFHDTVRANLLWACPDASDAEIRQALRLAAAEDFVLQLPDRMETIVGDRGVRLSGGERQRLALARAILRKPSLLILDEASSNLDSENELRIHSTVQSLRGTMAVLIITHRLTTVRGADVIYVLEHGRLTESGDWDELIRMSNGRFQALCRAQGVDIEQVRGWDNSTTRATQGLSTRERV